MQPRGNKKLASKYEGLYRVQAVESPAVYILDIGESQKNPRVQVSDFKRLIPPRGANKNPDAMTEPPQLPVPSRSTPPPAQDESSTEEEESSEEELSSEEVSETYSWRELERPSPNGHRRKKSRPSRPGARPLDPWVALESRVSKHRGTSRSPATCSRAHSLVQYRPIGPDESGLQGSRAHQPAEVKRNGQEQERSSLAPNLQQSEEFKRWCMRENRGNSISK